jgi:lipoate-protein ligase A
MPLSIRLLPYEDADGPHNMAADEVMLEGAIAGVAAMRLYGWKPATLSLGYFQRHSERLRDPRLASMPWVRRPTGGGAIVHDHDLTYAMALPELLRRGRTPSGWHEHIHAALARVLQEQQVAAEMQGGARRPATELDFLCFAVPQPGDIVAAGIKIVGGAQRVKHGALLQHGSVQVRGLDADRVANALLAELGFAAAAGDWTPDERSRIEELSQERYATNDWNERR